jgi:hypothetical protein
MNLTFEGVDISTEEKFVSYIKSLNKAILEQNAINEIKKELLNRLWKEKGEMIQMSRVWKQLSQRKMTC